MPVSYTHLDVYKRQAALLPIQGVAVADLQHAALVRFDRGVQRAHGGLRVRKTASVSPASTAPPQRDPVTAFQVRHRLHLEEPRGLEQRAYLRALVPAMFHHQPTFFLEVGCRLVGNDAQIVQPVGTGGQRRRRLEAQIAFVQMRVARFDVGRIADDQIEALASQRGEPAAMAEFDVGDVVSPGILASDGERRFTCLLYTSRCV